MVKDDLVLASLEVARTRGARARGLLGRDGIEGALLLAPCRSVHSFGMRFAIDVAFCAGDLDAGELEVVAVRTLRPKVPRVIVRDQRVESQKLHGARP